MNMPFLYSVLVSFGLFSAWEIATVRWIVPRPVKKWLIVRALLLGLVQGLLLIALYTILRTFENRLLASALWTGGILGLAMALLGWLHEVFSKEERSLRMLVRSVGTLIVSVGSVALAFLMMR